MTTVQVVQEKEYKTTDGWIGVTKNCYLHTCYVVCCHKMVHFRPSARLCVVVAVVGVLLPSAATLVSTSATPRPLNAEHSAYPLAPIFLAVFKPSSALTRGLPFRGSCLLSSRRSSLAPTRRMGVPGQKLFSSGYHRSLIFLRDIGSSTEKHNKNTSVCG